MLLLTMPSCRIQLCIQFKHSNCDVYFRINFTRLTHTSNYIHNYDCHSISFTKHHLVLFITFTFTFYGAFPLGNKTTEKTLSTQCERQLTLLHDPRQVNFLPPHPVGHGSHDELGSTKQCCPLDFALDTIHYTPPPPPPPLVDKSIHSMRELAEKSYMYYGGSCSPHRMVLHLWSWA